MGRHAFPRVLALGALAALALCGRAAPELPVAGGRIVVGYTDGGLAAAASLERRLGADRLATIPELGVHVLGVPAARARATLATLRADPRVRYAQEDGLVRALRIPNDEFWPTQWSPLRTNADRAWDLTTGSSQVVVAVVDTGVDPAQPDLRGKLVPGYDFVNGDADPRDDNDHGTAVAGIVAANSDNGIGVAGYCWRCLLMPVKVLGADGTGFSSALGQGIVWATDHGARVINVSLGGPLEDATVAGAAQYATAHGALVVAAAGNDSSSTLMYPAALPSVVSVGASDENDQLYGFSNSGALLAAPGENSTTANGGGYERLLGTSSAAPVVSGIAALAFSADLGASPGEVVQALEAGARRIPGVAYGRIDAYATVQALAPSPAPVPPIVSGGGGGTPGGTQTSGRAGSTRATAVFAGRVGGVRTSRSYSVKAGPGLLRATLTLSKRARAPVELRLLGPKGGLVASARGRLVVRLRAQVRRATYRLVVRTGAGQAVSFRLAVSYPRPA